VHVQTCRELGAGTGAQVSLTIKGDLSTQSNINLKTSKANSNPFEMGQIDVFEFPFLNLGNIISITYTLKINYGLFS
jgi:hypothetical protein